MWHLVEIEKYIWQKTDFKSLQPKLYRYGVLFLWTQKLGDMHVTVWCCMYFGSTRHDTVEH